jgi:ribonucleotide reductase alpha subunit
MQESYLLKCNLLTPLSASEKADPKASTKKLWIPIERPQHMLMRVSMGLHFSQEYKDFDRMRKDTPKIWESIKNILIEFLPKKSYKRLQEKAQTGTMDWKEVLILLTNRRAPLPMIEKVRGNIQTSTISWDELVDQFDDSPLSHFPNGISKRWESTVETYTLMREMVFTHATPTLYNSGTLKPQNSSCYLIQMPYDSLEGITDFWKKISEISKWAGGIGSSIHNIRPEGSYIKGTNGRSNGMRPLLKVINEISMYIDQGGNKRPGSHAVYVELWTGDIATVLDLKKPRGNDRDRARNLFYALWINDEYMRALEKESKTGEQCWYLMDPNQSPGLADVFDARLSTKWLTDEEVNAHPEQYAFTYLYRKYIREGKYIKKVSAVEIWKHICEVIEETGIPYMCFKDAGNRKSNQQNLGTIKSSNLCTEIHHARIFRFLVGR